MIQDPGQLETEGNAPPENNASSLSQNSKLGQISEKTRTSRFISKLLPANFTLWIHLGFIYTRIYKSPAALVQLPPLCSICFYPVAKKLTPFIFAL